MPVFNCFFKIVNKNKSAIIIYAGIFIALTFLFTTTATSDYGEDYSTTVLSIAVIDRDDSELSRALTDYLGELHELKELPDDTEALQDALFYREVEYILIIPGGFEESFTSDVGSASLENVKLPGSTTGIYVDNQIDRYLATANTYLGADFSLDDALTYTSSDLQLSTTVELYGEQEEGATGSDYYFHYLAYILIALMISVLGPILMVFNKQDIHQRMESSSFTLRQRNSQIALGCAVVSLGIWLLLMLIALLMYGEEMLTAVSGLQVLNSLVFLIVCVGIAFLLGQFLKSSTALSGMTNAIGLGMSFLCGIFVPQWLLGEGVLAFSRFLPAYWYIRSNDMLSGVSTLSSSDLRLYGEGIAIQLGFAIAIFAVAMVVSRQKKRNSIV